MKREADIKTEREREREIKGERRIHIISYIKKTSEGRELDSKCSAVY